MISNIRKRDNSIVIEFEKPIDKIELFEHALNIKERMRTVLINEHDETHEKHYMVGSRFLPNSVENFKQRTIALQS